MSHSDDLALIAISNGPAIGVDIELLHKPCNIMELAAHNFTESEFKELCAATPCEQTRSFLRGWTRKEACLKATGTGLIIQPNTFHVGLSGDLNIAIMSTAHRQFDVHVRSIDVGQDAIAAVAWIGSNSQFEHQPS